ncbi:MAG: hypothetical protein HYT15_00280 [Candidatus Magasanikbacteria bacterium]|nr:hypothetical protein [Candidatus Magasanikbacteria bacterium]
MQKDKLCVVLSSAIVAKKSIQFCWSQENKTSLVEEDGLVRVETPYCWGQRPDMVPLRNQETFLLLVPWNGNWLLYLNASGRTRIVKEIAFEEGREIDFWYTTVEDNQRHGMFV